MVSFLDCDRVTRIFCCDKYKFFSAVSFDNYSFQGGVIFLLEMDPSHVGYFLHSKTLEGSFLHPGSLGWTLQLGEKLKRASNYAYDV